MSEIVLKGIKKCYQGKIPVLDNFDLTIKNNEFIVLVGSSGCGKTTILNIIAGFENIDMGSLYIDGILMNDVAPKDRDISMVFQNYALYPHMTVYDNLSFALRLKKKSRKEIDKLVREEAELLGISDLLKRKPTTLSGGQQQRVAIGRALIRQPKIILMDEPLSNLDAKLRSQMRSDILKMKKKIFATVVYVTHDQSEALTLGDRIVVLNKGKINQVGTPSDVYDRPVNLFVAGFIGTPTMNFLHECELSIIENIYFVEIKGLKIKLNEFQQNALRLKRQEPMQIIVGFRPQHAVYNENGWNSIIEYCEMLGSEYYLHTRIDNDEIIIVVPKNKRELAIGDKSEFPFFVSPDMLQLFDKDTGNNLIWFDGKNSSSSQPVCCQYEIEKL